MSECEYSAESEEDYSSEDEESDMENEYDGGGDVGEVEGPLLGQIEKVESSCSSRSPSSENLEDCQPKLTDIIKTQQVIIESLRKELDSMRYQSIAHTRNRKCPSKSEESTSAVVSSFEDDDDELESLSSEESISHSSGYGAPAKNPMLIDVVIQNVMEHLPLKSLIVARLVCRKWNAVAISRISNKCGPILLEVHQPWKPSKGIKVSTYIDVMRSSLCCPISKYSISSFTALEELDRFFFHFGGNVKHIDLNFPEEFDDSQEFARLLTRKICHVESLRVGCCKMFKDAGFVTGLKNNDAAPGLTLKYRPCLKNLKVFCVGNIINMIPSKTWLEEYFNMCPNLEKLVLHVNFKENGNTFIRIVLEALLNLEVLKNIKSLMISCLTESHLRTLLKLADCGLRLKHFRFQDLSIHLTEISGATLETFLISQADHLESLEIDQSSNFPRIRHFQLPPMKRLKSLSIVSSQRISFGTLNYVNDFPKLEKMVLRGYDVFNCGHLFPHNIDNVFKRTITSHFLKVLSLPSKFSVSHFPLVLSKMFPNIEELEVRSVTNECLREIWESWPGLTKLKLVVSHFDDNIDSGMTGIPEEMCQELRDMSDLSERQLQEYKTVRGITDLRYLRSLELECRAMWIPCQLITDVTGYFALGQLKHLQNLKVTEIGVPEKFDLSNECIVTIIRALISAETSFKVMDDHGRWQLELGRVDLLRNTYESEPQLEDHNKDREYRAD